MLLSVQNIVADMRKVLAKNPQVEQQRLHRRVFLDNINPENQALLVSASYKRDHYILTSIYFYFGMSQSYCLLSEIEILILLV